MFSSPKSLSLTALLGLGLAAAPALAQPTAPQPAGVYRSAAAYRRNLPAPAGEDIRFAPRRNQFVVSTRRGGTMLRRAVPRDSVWGYANASSRRFRVVGPDDYRIEQADTITVYSRTATLSGSPSALPEGAPNRGNISSARHYYFSRGVAGLIFPLTDKYLRAVFEAGSPAFVAAVAARPFGRELSAYDAAANAFFIAALFRASGGK